MSSAFESMAIANQAVIASLNHPPIPSILSGEADTGLDTIKLVESARKSKAPIVGIPMPGERPFCIKGDLLRDSLKGMGSRKHPSNVHYQDQKRCPICCCSVLRKMDGSRAAVNTCPYL